MRDTLSHLTVMKPPRWRRRTTRIRYRPLLFPRAVFQPIERGFGGRIQKAIQPGRRLP